MKIPYTFTILRYVHDVLSGEFINVGVVLYAPQTRFLDAKFTNRYVRLSRMFTDVNGDHFRNNIKYIREGIQEQANRLQQLPLDKPATNVKEIVARVLPIDDSSLQFSAEGSGIAEALDKTLEQLYVRLVERYQEKGERQSRSEDDVWKAFKRKLEEKDIAKHLKPHKITGQNYEFEFKHCWKNDKWHVNQPVSFDLSSETDIIEKANAWLGRVTSLSDGNDKFKLHILLGSPHETTYNKAFGKAQNILNKVPCEHEFVKEEDVESFAEHLKQDISRHFEEEQTQKQETRR